VHGDGDDESGDDQEGGEGVDGADGGRLVDGLEGGVVQGTLAGRGPDLWEATRVKCRGDAGRLVSLRPAPPRAGHRRRGYLVAGAFFAAAAFFWFCFFCVALGLLSGIALRSLPGSDDPLFAR
jgi:hypothetical protein